VHRSWPFAAVFRRVRVSIAAIVPALALALSAALAAALATPASVAAHTVQHAGPYTIEIGWQHEPTYVGESNGVQVIVSQGEHKPVNDLKTDDLSVVVTTGGQDSDALTFEPGFDLEEMEGDFGEYNAPIVPTAPGDYTFHITGSIHGQKVDLTVTSGDETFDTVKGTSDLEFPVKLPTLTELTTKVDQIDSRLTSAQSGPTSADVAAAKADASNAQSAADRALLVGGAIGAVGIVVGLLGVALALGARRGRPA
jgi:hypothetical protein